MAHTVVLLVRGLRPNQVPHFVTGYVSQNFHALHRVNSFRGMGLYLGPLFLLLFSVKPYSVNLRGIQLATSQNERRD